MIPNPQKRDSAHTIRQFKMMESLVDRLQREQDPDRAISKTVPAIQPPQRDWCYGVVYNGTDDGRWSWDQVTDDFPEKAIVAEGGFYGRVEDDDHDDFNVARGLNGETASDVEDGTVVVVFRAMEEWRFIAVPNPGYGYKKKLLDMDIVCDDETGQATLIKTYA